MATTCVLQMGCTANCDEWYLYRNPIRFHVHLIFIMRIPIPRKIVFMSKWGSHGFHVSHKVFMFTCLSHCRSRSCGFWHASLKRGLVNRCSIRDIASSSLYYLRVWHKRGTLLQTWVFAKGINTGLYNVGWNYFSIISELQRLHCWSLGMDK